MEALWYSGMFALGLVVLSVMITFIRCCEKV